jgi:hypothetical protein
MGDVVSFEELKYQRRKKLKKAAERTPHQLASNTLLLKEGYEFSRKTPAGNLLYTKREVGKILVATINQDGKIARSTWDTEDE